MLIILIPKLHLSQIIKQDMISYIESISAMNNIKINIDNNNSSKEKTVTNKLIHIIISQK